MVSAAMRLAAAVTTPQNGCLSIVCEVCDVVPIVGFVGVCEAFRLVGEGDDDVGE